MSSELLRWRRQAHAVDYRLWEQLARRVGTTPGYLNQLAYGNRNVTPRRACKIEQATKEIRIGRRTQPIKKETLIFF